jgi:class 3 adenylate cyclase
MAGLGGVVCPACGAANRPDARFCDVCGAPLTPSVDKHRKLVTVVFCDVVGSTALGETTDAEALQALLARYFERLRSIVEFHGGSVEKFIGDAVVAVFGVPLAHEDDALRACRAAAGMRQALPELGVQGRIGVSSGVVVAGTVERLATGNAVNLAARLQQAAEPGEVLVGEATVELARGLGRVSLSARSSSGMALPKSVRQGWGVFLAAEVRRTCVGDAGRHLRGLRRALGWSPILRRARHRRAREPGRSPRWRSTGLR